MLIFRAPVLLPAAHVCSRWSPPSPRLGVGRPGILGARRVITHTFSSQCLNHFVSILLRACFPPVSPWRGGYLNLLFFLPVCGLLFHFITLFFEEQKFKILIKSNLPIFK